MSDLAAKLEENQEELANNQQSLNTPSNSATGGNGEDLEEEDDKPTSSRERRKIEIRFIQDKSRRHITFSKRKAGIMKKAYELSVLTGTQVLLLVVSETGLVYTFTTPKLQPLVTKPEGKNLIQACLNAPEEPGEDDEAPNVSNGPQQSSNPSASNQQGPQAGQQNEHQDAAAAAAAAQQAAQAQAQQNQGHPNQANAYPQQPGIQNLPPNSGYLNAEQAAVYQTYFGGINNQQGQY